MKSECHIRYNITNNHDSEILTSMSPIPKNQRIKLYVGGGLLVIAVVVMIISATQATADFFMTVEEVQNSQKDLLGENLRVSGAVIGESIIYDVETGMLNFTIAHIPAGEDEITINGGLEAVLHQAVMDPDTPRLNVIYAGAPPDMLRGEVQAILTGTLQADGTFLVEELLLKCPSKYEEALPDQTEP